jgi:lactoylglutathione lyase
MKFLWTTINVKDLNRSIEFYSTIVGLKLLNRFQARPGMEIAFMGNGTENETQVELIADVTTSTVHFTECVTIGFSANSVDAMLEMMKSNNIPVHTGPFETPRFKYFTIKDPDGLNVQLFQQK